MKHKNFPTYKKTRIVCTCGAFYETKSTKQYNIDICSKCHPFFTGTKKMIDIEGRIEKFKNKYNYKIKT